MHSSGELQVCFPCRIPSLCDHWYTFLQGSYTRYFIPTTMGRDFRVGYQYPILKKTLPGQWELTTTPIQVLVQYLSCSGCKPRLLFEFQGSYPDVVTSLLRPNPISLTVCEYGYIDLWVNVAHDENRTLNHRIPELMPLQHVVVAFTNFLHVINLWLYHIRYGSNRRI